MLRLILDSLRRRKGQSSAALFGVAMGVSLLFAVLVLYLGLERGMELGRQKLGADLLVVPASAWVDADKALFAGSPMNVYMNRKLADQVRAIPGVRRVEAQFYTQSLKLDCCSVGVEVRLVGIEPGTAQRVATLSSEGRAQLEPDEVIIGSNLLMGMGRPGSLIELLGDIFRIAYHMDPTGTSLDHSILMPIETARKLAANSPQLRAMWQTTGDPASLVSALLLELDNPGDLKAVTAAVNELGEVKVIKADEAFQRVKRQMLAIMGLLAGAGLLTALTGVAYLISHFASVAWDRKGEWALYRALGATRLRLAQLVVGEAVALALGGALLGLPAGIVWYRAALANLARQNAFPFIPPAPAVFILAALGALVVYTLIGFLAALAPALRVAQLEPAPAMAQGDID